MTTFGLEVTPNWKTFRKFIQICRGVVPLADQNQSSPSKWLATVGKQTKQRFCGRGACLAPTPKTLNKEEKFFCSRSLGNPTLECWSEFSKISENKSWIVEKVNSVATSNFKRIFLLHKQIYFAQALKSPKKSSGQNKSLLIGVESNSIMSCGDASCITSIDIITISE